MDSPQLAQRFGTLLNGTSRKQDIWDDNENSN